MKKIRVGFGTNGDIYEDLEKCKACNFCTHFMGYGLHAVAGKCLKKDKEISGGYIGNYRKIAMECDSFDCKPDLLVEVQDEHL